MHSWYLQENISSKAHIKHIHPGHHDQQDSKPGNQGAFSKHTLSIDSTSYPLGKYAVTHGTPIKKFIKIRQQLFELFR